MLAKPSKNSNDSSTSNEDLIILKREDKMSNGSDIIDLNVILSLSYQENIFKISVPVSIIRENSNELFDINEMIDSIFSKLDDKISSEYILSYYLNDEDEKYNNNIKSYNYLGEINGQNIKSQKKFLKIPKDKKIYLKLRHKIRIEKLLNPDFFEDNKNTYTNSLFNSIKLNEDEEEEKTNEKLGPRGKEKTIGFAITTVFKWEKILQKSNNEISLNEAANMVGVRKKTLDHYKQAIIEGKKNNFDFKKYCECKINRLINYNNKFEKCI